MRKFLSVFLICSMLFAMVNIPAAGAAERTEFPFTDIMRNFSTGYLNVRNLWEKGIISGKTDTLFAPYDTLTREEAAKIIVLATETELSKNTGSFSDAEDGAWYVPYIETAKESGLLNGIGDGKFGIGANITRQEAATLIVRMADYMGIKIEKITQVVIGDISDAADYAVESIQKLADMKVLTYKDGKYSPKDDINRLDFCIYLDRVLISDGREYDDVIQDWVPVEKDIDSYDSQVIAFEDFEQGITTLSEYEPGFGTQPASQYIVNDMGKDSKSSIKLTSSSDYSAVELYMNNPEPTTTYYISYDVKTENLGSAYIRANFEWYGPHGSIFGSYDTTLDLKGDNDWENHNYMSAAPTPDLSPKFLRIIFSLRGATSGTAWVDNIKIYKVVYEPITTFLKLPAYKGLITEPNGESDIRLTSYITGMGDMYNPDDTELVVSLSDLKGNVLMESEQMAPTGEMDVTFSSKTLEIGDYDLAAKLFDVKTGKTHGENHYMIRKRESNYKPKYYFDEYGRLIKDGEPYFAIGSYALGITEKDIEDLKDTSIKFMICNSVSNFFANYDLLDKMADCGLSSIFLTETVFKDAFRGQYQNPDVTTIASERKVLEREIKDLDLKNKDALMGYGINNESPAGKWANRMGWHNQFLAELDMDHFTYGVSGGGKGTAIDLSRCQDIYCCDDPYPITGSENDEIWGVWEKSKPVVEEAVNRPVWTSVQVSDLKVMGGNYASRKRGPSEQELRNMAWQAVCAGAQGIVYYAKFHLDKDGVSRPESETLPEMIRVSDELDTFKDVILSIEDTPDICASADNMDRFAYGVRRYNGKTYVFLVNSSLEPQTVSIKLDGVKSAERIYSDKKVKLNDNGFIDVKLEPLGVEVLVAEQPEPKSDDCSLKNLHFSNGDKNYFISVEKDANDVITVAPCEVQINYDAAIHKDAVLKIDGEVVANKGTITIEGKDEIRFTVVSEDGKHTKDYKYSIIRKSKKTE